MEEEITDINDYVDWLKWVSNVERKKKTMFLQIVKKIPILLQVHEAKGGDFNNNSSKKLTSSDNNEINTRWKEIC